MCFCSVKYWNRCCDSVDVEALFIPRDEFHRVRLPHGFCSYLHIACCGCRNMYWDPGQVSYRNGQTFVFVGNPSVDILNWMERDEDLERAGFAPWPVRVSMSEY